MSLIFVVHAAATFFMIGIIWFAQIVHYPLFERVGESVFAEYEKLHQKLTTRVVLPAMLTEAVTAVALLLQPMHESQRVALWLASGLLVCIWLATVFVQVPLHRHLSAGFQMPYFRKLVRSNWLRTVLWSLRGAILITLQIS